jgi:hypothetical protein
MIHVKTNIAEVANKNAELLKKLSNPDEMLRTMATTVLGLMKVRIHTDGLDANGNRIGTYSPAYMKVRQGIFTNSGVFSKGKNKGSIKDAGVFTKGKNKGQARPRYNRGPDTKVILSLTRQMENDMKVIAVDNGYGIGYSNPHNFDKSQWTEATYKRQGKIFALSSGETDAVTAIAEKFVNDALSG